MKTNKQGKIKVPKSGFKRSRFNWSHDVNTTFNWGEIQPTQCKLLIPGSKTTMSAQTLIRLAPMVAPTFGRVKYKTYNQFVDIAEIMPNFDAMMAQEPVSTGVATKVPQQLPWSRLGALSSVILNGARATMYFADSQTDAANGNYWTQYRIAPNITPNSSDPTCADWYTAMSRIMGTGTQPFSNSVTTDAFNKVANGIMPEINGMGVRFGSFGAAYANIYGSTGDVPFILGAKSIADLCPVRRDYVYDGPGSSSLSIQDYQKEVTFDSADYVLEGQYEYSAGQIQYFALAVELSDFGKRLRKVLQGCGYQIDFTSAANVSILPLIAQYKAYFDIFGLELYQGWETTLCSKLIKDIEVNFKQNITSSMVRTGKGVLATIDTNNYGLAFLMCEAANEWYTDDADYVSAHIAKLGVSPLMNSDGRTGFIDVYSGNTIIQDINIAPGTVSDQTQTTELTTGSMEDTGLGAPGNGNIGGIASVDYTYHTQIDAELLKRMYKWVNRNTILGRRIAELLRAQGLGKYVDECKSNYIGSTDTMVTISDVVSQAATADATLGEYGGRGLQYVNDQTLVFENDSYGYWITFATVVPESGYTQGLDPTLQSLDKFNLYNPDFDAIGMEVTPRANIVATNYITGPGFTSNASFGFIPRYSKFKVCQNLVNGDFNRHGKRNTYLPYTLDKQLNINDFQTDAEAYKFTGLTNKIWNYAKINKSARDSSMPIAGNVWRCPTKYSWLGNFNRIFLNIGDRDDSEISNVKPGDAVGINDYNDDNFLGHSILDVQCYAPMKPIVDSYGLEDMEDPNGKAGAEFTSKA